MWSSPMLILVSQQQYEKRLHHYSGAFRCVAASSITRGGKYRSQQSLEWNSSPQISRLAIDSLLTLLDHFF
jgi:hypothetical protein